jgi:predicted ribosome quality control (RQC) complex YloA/Tae2 family protein
VDSVRQVGVERVVVISFGSETFANHIILELYSQGNIILTDHNYRILQCIRSHEFNDKVKTAVGEIYPFEHAANIYIENIDISA